VFDDQKNTTAVVLRLPNVTSKLFYDMALPERALPLKRDQLARQKWPVTRTEDYMQQKEEALMH
jgi:hypothetical protein